MNKYVDLNFQVNNATARVQTKKQSNIQNGKFSAWNLKKEIRPRIA